MQSSLLTLAGVPATVPAAVPGGSVGDAAIRMGVALAALVAVLGVVTYALPKIVAKARAMTPRGGSQSAAISILSSARVGPQALLVLVSCCNRQMLVGVTPSGVSLIALCGDILPSAAPATTIVKENMKESSPDFLALLGQLRRQRTEAAQ
jgi:flagellar biogenesis protein FliO